MINIRPPRDHPFVGRHRSSYRYAPEARLGAFGSRPARPECVFGPANQPCGPHSIRYRQRTALTLLAAIDQAEVKNPNRCTADFVQPEF